MDWSKVKSLVGGVAPVLGSLVGGPVGGTVGGIISNILGTDNDPKMIATALQDPKSLEKIRLYEMKHVEKLEALQLEELRINMQDRDSARKMQVETRSYLPPILAVVVVIGFFGVLYVVAVHGASISDETREPLLILLGALTAAFGQVFNFFFGSSAGSQEKTKVLSRK